MRWSNLTIESPDAAAQAALPGYREPATVRHFDAPEALDTRFYEVRAKSVLNRVPAKSQMPFRWTINPYRGCSHACTYCLAPETPVLLADGRHKPIGDLVVGERIIGTTQAGRYRRYTETEVRDVWDTRKPAFRVTLSDGTELITSGDHRFLTHRGWKHVAGAEHGPLRPHLTANDLLLGTGGFAAQPDRDDPEYRRGYLCGMVRGDGHLGRSAYERGERHHFRLALADKEPLRRRATYLARDGVITDRFQFLAAADMHRAIMAIRTQKKDAVDRVRSLVAWPERPGDAWCKGFLAGIFDAEGSCGDVLRIANTDPALVDRTKSCLARFGFRFVVEGRPAQPLSGVRLLGGLAEQLRFCHTVDPAMTRKRRITGVALRSSRSLQVVDIEPLGLSLPLVDITTGTGDFIANGLVSHNCFARPTHAFLGMDAGRDFEREIVVKVNAPEVLAAELAKPSWRHEHVALGTNTDPYQWVEGRYKLMRGIWGALRDSRTPCSVLTKSPLVVRDIDLLREIAAVTQVSANLSIPTLDDKAWRATEPRTPSPRARFEAVRALNDAGIPCGILVAPLMPGINDDPRQVEAILDAAVEAGATSVGGIGLHLRGEVRGVFLDWLRTARPDLLQRYERLYARGAYAPTAERERLAGLLRAGTEARPSLGPFARWSTDHPAVAEREPAHQDSGPGPAAPPRASSVRPVPAVQVALF